MSKIQSESLNHMLEQKLIANDEVAMWCAGAVCVYRAIKCKYAHWSSPLTVISKTGAPLFIAKGIAKRATETNVWINDFTLGFI